MDGDVETLYENQLWKNRIVGHQRAANTAKSRAEAVKTGRHMAKARRTVHIVRSEDGTVASRDDYRTSRRGVPLPPE
ncbi:DUF2188 domain-containing protein [Amycolatopsis dendrobii]|uniref:DUF2188 domain-containing protein n=1 Tax=Amycolatopsis dendrobii TaxID=2760662 RepID=A0A7W3VWL8_9PSEU|nr:DUF2188 domain-containing protein [Amycolatopsis dendrobii]MBB1154578.1 DUF2188 domain-containing protein [Amycolatopsis dendrobii]